MSSFLSASYLNACLNLSTACIYKVLHKAKTVMHASIMSLLSRRIARTLGKYIDNLADNALKLNWK